MKEFFSKKKNALLIALIFAIIVAVYNLVLFLVAEPDVRTSGFWTAYAFMWAAFLSVIGAIIFNAIDIKSSKLSIGWININVAGVYLVLEFIVAVIIMAVRTNDYVPCLVTQIIMFAAFLIAFILFSLAKNYNYQHFDENKKSVGYIKQLSALLKAAYNAAEEYDVKENLNRLYDFCRTSNPMSKGTELLEKEIIEEAQRLNNMIINGAGNEEIVEASAKIRALMTQRNAGI